MQELLKKETLLSMISKLENKGIKFKHCTIEEAKDYLENNNNYYNISTYKRNFPKENGRYSDVDFAYLKDLAIIDYRLRLIMFRLTIDIEQYLKMYVLKKVDNIEKDSYEIVQDFLHKQNNDYYFKLLTKNKLKRYNVSIFEFLGVIPFKNLYDFYKYLVLTYDLNDDKKYLDIIPEIVNLRNVVAHNDSLLNDLNPSTKRMEANKEIEKYLKSCKIETGSIEKQLSNINIKQITYTLYMYNILVTSEGIKKYVKEEITDFFYNRITHHKEYYKDNKLLKSVYNYFDKIIENNYKINI